MHMRKSITNPRFPHTHKTQDFSMHIATLTAHSGKMCVIKITYLAKLGPCKGLHHNFASKSSYFNIVEYTQDQSVVDGGRLHCEADYLTLGLTSSNLSG